MLFGNGNYRFSEDLDFSALEGVPRGEEMERLVREACETAVRLLDEHAPSKSPVSAIRSRDPHPGGQEAFAIRARFPWQSRPQTRVMIEVTMDERVLLTVERRQVIHDYGDPLNAEVIVYSLEEIVAEKLRALLQQADIFERRGWSRSRARATNDLWRVLDAYKDRMDWPALTHSCGRSVLFEACPSQGQMISSMKPCFHTLKRLGTSGLALWCQDSPLSTL